MGKEAGVAAGGHTVGCCGIPIEILSGFRPGPGSGDGEK